MPNPPSQPTTSAAAELRNMKLSRLITEVAVAGPLGLIVLNLNWVLKNTGLDFQIPRSNFSVTPEYWVGAVFVFLLGYVFAHYPVTCAVAFMWIPVAPRHSIYIFQRGVPNLWPVELLMIALLTLPYIGLAYLDAYFRRQRASGNARAAN